MFQVTATAQRAPFGQRIEFAFMASPFAMPLCKLAPFKGLGSTRYCLDAVASDVWMNGPHPGDVEP